MTTTNNQPYGFPQATDYNHGQEERFDTRRTFYYSEQQLVDFDLAKMKLTQETRQEIDKSELAQLAMDIVNEDVRANGSTGLVGQKLAALKQSRSVGTTKAGGKAASKNKEEPKS